MDSDEWVQEAESGYAPFVQLPRTPRSALVASVGA